MFNVQDDERNAGLEETSETAIPCSHRVRETALPWLRHIRDNILTWLRHLRKVAFTCLNRLREVTQTLSRRTRGDIRTGALSRLRRRFVLITMSLVGSVLAIMLAISVGNNYSVQSSRINDALSAAVGMGRSADLRLHIGEQPQGPRGSNTNNTGPFGGQPMFVVLFNNETALYETPGNYVEMDAVVLVSAIEELQKTTSNQGLLWDLNLYYARANDPLNASISYIAFADASPALNTLGSNVAASVVIWIISMALILLISLFLSRMALHPVEEAWQKQKRFIADASHELKTPLTVILANANIIASQPNSTVAEQTQWLESTQEEGRRLDGLVRDLLLLAQTDEEQAATGTPSNEHDGDAEHVCDLSAVVNKAVMGFDAVFYERGVRPETFVTPHLHVMASQTRLTQLVTILLDNAAKYAPKGDCVRVALQRTNASIPQAELTITNGGEVIPPKTLEKLFERFYRGDETHSDTTEGYGLGLSIARNIAESLKGTIKASSTIQTGTSFCVTLPLALTA